MRILIILVGIILLSNLTVLAVVYINNQESIKRDSQALMIITGSGGMCDGPCDHSRYRVFDDGIYENNKKLTASQINQLKQAINDTDFLRYGLKANPTCPSFADGVDTVLIFPQKYKDKEFVLCRMDIPDDDKTFDVIDSITGIDSRRRQPSIGQ